MDTESSCLCDSTDPSDPMEYLEGLKQKYLDRTAKLQVQQEELEKKIMKMEAFLGKSEVPSQSTCPCPSRDVPKVFPESPVRDSPAVPKIMTDVIQNQQPVSQQCSFFQKMMENAKNILSMSCQCSIKSAPLTSGATTETTTATGNITGTATCTATTTRMGTTSDNTSTEPPTRENDDSVQQNIVYPENTSSRASTCSCDITDPSTLQEVSCSCNIIDARIIAQRSQQVSMTVSSVTAKEPSQDPQPTDPDPLTSKSDKDSPWKETETESELISRECSCEVCNCDSSSIMDDKHLESESAHTYNVPLPTVSVFAQKIANSEAQVQARTPVECKAVNYQMLADTASKCVTCCKNSSCPTNRAVLVSETASKCVTCCKNASCPTKDGLGKGDNLNAGIQVVSPTKSKAVDSPGIDNSCCRSLSCPLNLNTKASVGFVNRSGRDGQTAPNQRSIGHDAPIKGQDRQIGPDRELTGHDALTQACRGRCNPPSGKDRQAGPDSELYGQDALIQASRSTCDPECRSQQKRQDGQNQCAFIGSPLLNANDFHEAGDVKSAAQMRSNKASSSLKLPCDCNTPQGPRRLCQTSVFSLTSNDIMEMQNITELAKKEKEMKAQIEELQKRERQYQEATRNVENLVTKTKNPCCFCQGHNAPSNMNNEIDKISRELRLENQILKSELEDMKMELKHCLEKIEGPMQHKLQTEKQKCEHLQKELQAASKSMLVNQDAYSREMNQLKMQLCCACTNITELNQMNLRLKDEMTQLDCLCQKLEDDLIKQKVNEAETIKRLTNRKYEGGTLRHGGDAPSNQQSEEFKCESNLDVIARKLSKTIKDLAPCEECSKLPSELASAAKCIKDLTDMVRKRKGKASSTGGCTCQSGPPSKPPSKTFSEEECCTCCGPTDGGGEYPRKAKMADEKTVKTLLPVPESFVNKGTSSKFDVDIAHSSYYSAKGEPLRERPCAKVGTPCIQSKGTVTRDPTFRKGDYILPCSDIGEPCKTGKSVLVQVPPNPSQSCRAPCSEKMEPVKDQGMQESLAPEKEGVPVYVPEDPSYSAVMGQVEVPEGKPVQVPETPSQVDKSCIALCPSHLKGVGSVEVAGGVISEGIGDIPGKTSVASGQGLEDGKPGEGDIAEKPSAEGPESGVGDVAEKSSAASDKGPATGTPDVEDMVAKTSSVSDKGPEGAKSGQLTESVPESSQFAEKISSPETEAPTILDEVVSGPEGEDSGEQVKELPEDEVVASGMGRSMGEEGPVETFLADVGEAEGMLDTVVEMSGEAGDLIGEREIPFEEERFGGEFPVDVDNKAFAIDEPPPDLHMTTTITGSGTLEVITEGPEGTIETTLTYTKDGNIEVVTEMTDQPEDGRPPSDKALEKFASQPSTDVPFVSAARVPCVPSSTMPCIPSATCHSMEKVPGREVCDPSMSCFNMDQQPPTQMRAMPIDSSLISGPSVPAIESPYTASSGAELTSKLASISSGIKPGESPDLSSYHGPTAVSGTVLGPKIFADASGIEQAASVGQAASVHGAVPSMEQTGVRPPSAQGFAGQPPAGLDGLPSEGTTSTTGELRSGEVFTPDQFVSDAEMEEGGVKSVEGRIVAKEASKAISFKESAASAKTGSQHTQPSVGDGLAPGSLPGIASEQIASISMEGESSKTGSKTKSGTEMAGDSLLDESGAPVTRPSGSRTTRDCSCQSKDQTDQSCQCCECKTVGVTTSGDKETITEKDEDMGKIHPDALDGTKTDTDSEFVTISETTDNALAQTPSTKKPEETLDDASPMATTSSTGKEAYKAGDWEVIIDDDMLKKHPELRGKSSKEQHQMLVDLGYVTSKYKIPPHLLSEYPELEGKSAEQQKQFLSQMGITCEEPLEEADQEPEIPQLSESIMNMHPQLAGKSKEEQMRILEELGYTIPKETILTEEMLAKHPELARLSVKAQQESLRKLGYKPSLYKEDIIIDDDLLQKHPELQGKSREDQQKLLRDMGYKPSKVIEVDIPVDDDMLAKHPELAGKTNSQQQQMLKSLGYQPSVQIVVDDDMIQKHPELAGKSLEQQQSILKSLGYVGSKASEIKVPQKISDIADRTSEVQQKDITYGTPKASGFKVDDELLTKHPELAGKSSEEQQRLLKSLGYDVPQKISSKIGPPKSISFNVPETASVPINQEMIEKHPELIGKSSAEQQEILKNLGYVPSAMATKSQPIQISKEMFETHPELIGRSLGEQQEILRSLGYVASGTSDMVSKSQPIQISKEMFEKHPELVGRSLGEQQEILRSLGHIPSDMVSKSQPIQISKEVLQEHPELIGKSFEEQQEILKKLSVSAKSSALVDQSLLEKHPELAGKSATEQEELLKELGYSIPTMEVTQEMLEQHPELVGKTSEQQQKILSEMGLIKPVSTMQIKEDVLKSHPELVGKTFEEQKEILQSMGYILDDLVTSSVQAAEEKASGVKVDQAAAIASETGSKFATPQPSSKDVSVTCKAPCRSAAVLAETLVQPSEKDVFVDARSTVEKQPSSKEVSVTCRAPCRSAATIHTATPKQSDKEIPIIGDVSTSSISKSKSVSLQKKPSAKNDSVTCKASCRTISVQSSKTKSSSQSYKEIKEIVASRTNSTTTTSSSDARQKEKAKKKEKSKREPGEVPSIVSELSDKERPAIESTKKPRSTRKKRSRMHDCTKCDCRICQSDRQKQSRTSQVKSCECPPSNMMMLPPMMVVPPMQMTFSMPPAGHAANCRCNACLCKETPRRRPVASKKPEAEPPTSDENAPPSKPLKSHPSSCECIDCLCLPKIKKLAATKEYPVVYDTKQIYQVKVKCETCANAQNARRNLEASRSRIPISTSTANPPRPRPDQRAGATDQPLDDKPVSAVESVYDSVACDCSACICSDCPDETKRPQGVGAKPSVGPKASEVGAKPSQVGPKPSQVGGDKNCCCKNVPCTCDPCSIEELTRKLREAEQKLAAGPPPAAAPSTTKPPAGDDEPCTCVDCVCPGSDSPTLGKVASSAPQAPPSAIQMRSGDTTEHSPDCDCPECVCPGSDAVKKPGVDKQPSAIKPAGAGDDDCTCAVCACPGSISLAPKAGDAPPPAIEACDCKDCKCSPCADPRKQGAAPPAGRAMADMPDMADCDCPECKCMPCADPKISKSGKAVSKIDQKGEGPHPEECDCLQCQCMEGGPQEEKQISTVSPSQIKGVPSKVSKTTGMAESEPHPADCECDQCQCQEETIQTDMVGLTEKGIQPASEKEVHTLDCSCPECLCPECSTKATHAPGCQCGECVCAPCDKKDGAVKSQFKLGVDGRGGDQDVHPDGCCCIKCACDICSDSGKQAAGAKSKSAAVIGDTPHVDGCACVECVCKECLMKLAPVKHQEGCQCTQCLCVECLKKMQQQGDIAPAVSTTGQPGPAASLGRAGLATVDLDSNRGPNCTCATCICIDCKGAGTAGQPPEGRDGGMADKAQSFIAHGDQCSCPDCQCKPCFSKVQPEELCSCEVCTCVTCSKKRTAVTSEKGTAAAHMASPQEGGHGDQCACADCQCKPCFKKVEPPGECTCNVCTCVVCSKVRIEGAQKSQGQMMPGQQSQGQMMPGQQSQGQMMPGQQSQGQMMGGQQSQGQMMAGQQSQGRMGGTVFTDPPPFQAFDRIDCNCQRCECVMCSSNRPPVQGRAAGQQSQGQMMPGQQSQGQMMACPPSQGQMVPGQRSQGQMMTGQQSQGQMMACPPSQGQMVPGQRSQGQMMPGQQSQGQMGGTVFTDPPPFQAFDRIDCNCQRCECVICSSNRPPVQGRAAGQQSQGQMMPGQQSQGQMMAGQQSQGQMMACPPSQGQMVPGQQSKGQMIAGQQSQGRMGGTVFTDPPPFQALDRIDCNCQRCECVICSNRPPVQAGTSMMKAASTQPSSTGRGQERALGPAPSMQMAPSIQITPSVHFATVDCECEVCACAPCNKIMDKSATVVRSQVAAAVPSQLATGIPSQLAAGTPSQLAGRAASQHAAAAQSQLAAAAASQHAAAVASQPVLAATGSQQAAAVQSQLQAAIASQHAAAIASQHAAEAVQSQLAAVAPSQLVTGVTSQLAQGAASQHAASCDCPTCACACKQGQLAASQHGANCECGACICKPCDKIMTTTAAATQSQLATGVQSQLLAASQHGPNCECPACVCAPCNKIMPTTAAGVQSQLAAGIPSQVATGVQSQLAAGSPSQLAGTAASQHAAAAQSQLAAAAASQHAAAVASQQLAAATDSQHAAAAQSQLQAAIASQHAAAIASQHAAEAAQSQLAAAVPSQLAPGVPSQLAAGVPSQVAGSQHAANCECPVCACEPCNKIMSKSVAAVQSQLAPGVPSQVAAGVRSQIVPGVPSQVAAGVPSQLAPGVPSQLATGVRSQLAAGVPSQLATGVRSQLAPGVPSQLATGAPSQTAAGAASQHAAAAQSQLAAAAASQHAAAVASQHSTIPAGRAGAASQIEAAVASQHAAAIASQHAAAAVQSQIAASYPSQQLAPPGLVEPKERIRSDGVPVHCYCPTCTCDEGVVKTWAPATAAQSASAAVSPSKARPTTCEDYQSADTLVLPKPDIRQMYPPGDHPASCDCAQCRCQPCADISNQHAISVNPSVQLGASPSCADDQLLAVSQFKAVSKVAFAGRAGGVDMKESVRAMDDVALVKSIQTANKENCECKEQIEEIKKTLEKIKCACTEAEFRSTQSMAQSMSVEIGPSTTGGKPFVKQAVAFGQTMSGLKMALNNLQAKCKAKDKMIEAMTTELVQRGNVEAFDKVLDESARMPRALDYDQAEDVKSLNQSQLTTNVLYAPTQVRDGSTAPCDLRCTASKGVEVRTHKHKKKKNSSDKKIDDDCSCSKPQIMQKEERDCQKLDLRGFEVVDIRRITDDSLILKWNAPKNDQVQGYDIFVNGNLATKVMSGTRTSAMMHSLDLSKSVQITIYAVTRCGRVEPPAIAIYEIKS